MNKSRVATIAVVSGLTAALLLTGGASAQADSDNSLPSLVQVGTYDYLTQPDFSGLTSIGEVAKGNTIGLGTFENLDGELVMVGGSVYQIRPDGTPRQPDSSTRTPFMQAVRFAPQIDAPVPPGMTCAQLPDLIQATAGQTNGIVAVRVRGTFTDLLTRSVTADPPPYQPLSQTIAAETRFPLGTRRAALVGFWQGKDALGLGQDGLHLHGLTANRDAGGHVLSCTVGDDVQLSVQSVPNVRVITPHD